MKAKGLPVSTLTIQHLNEIFQLPLDRYAAEYSTGMKKKLGFMALLLQENDVFILDEPFNGVDLKGCILMKRLIRQLKAKEKTVIISSHLIASLREICDIIHYLNEGVIYKEYHEETTEEIEEDILCNTKKDTVHLILSVKHTALSLHESYKFNSIPILFLPLILHRYHKLRGDEVLP